MRLSICRSTLAGLASLCALAGFLALTGASAQAQVTHEYIPALSEKLSEPVPAKGPHGEAIAQPGPLNLEAAGSVLDSGHLWIYEKGARIDEYDASTGEFMAQIPNAPGACCGVSLSLAFGHTAGEGTLYAIGFQGESSVTVYSEAGTLKGTWKGAGTPAGSFNHDGEPVGVAVDNSTDPLDEHKGDVYVADAGGGHDVIDIFHPEADGQEHYVGKISGTSPTEPFSEPIEVAVSEVNGDVVVQDRGTGTIDILEPTTLGEYVLVGKISGTPSGPFDRGGFHTLAVDGASGDIYITDTLSIQEHQEQVVDQFSATGTFIGQFNAAATPTGSFEFVGSMVVDPKSNVYVFDRGGGVGRVDAFGEDVVTPDVTTEPPSSVGPFGATLNGTVNPHEAKAGAVTCRFQWGTSKSFGKVAPCEPEGVAEGGSPVAVHAALSGLQSDTRYFYRLEATNGNGTNPGEVSQDQEFTTPGPGIHDESVTDLADTSVTFDASVNPHNVPSSVYFQYGTSTGYGSVVPAPPGEAIGSGEGDVETTPHHIQGLLPGAVYHYRVVVVSEPKPGETVIFDGADRVFTTQTAAVSELLDGRHWEMVSPPDKKGALILPVLGGRVVRAADTGGAISYVVDQPTEAEPQGSALDMQVLSTRGPEGWESQDIAPPHVAITGPSVGQGNEYRFFSADLSRAVVQVAGSFVPGLSAEASESTAMLRTLDGPCGSSCYRPLVTGKPGFANVPPGTVFGQEPNGECEHLFCGPGFVTATPDLSHVIVKSEGERPGEKGLGYLEWSGGKLTPLPIEGSILDVSSDGSRVFFDQPGLQKLYMRDTVSGKAVQLDVAEPACVAQGKCASGGGNFWFASADGSRVFFTDTHRLTKGAGLAGSDLYECEMVENAGEPECRLSDIATEARGVLGVSKDGSYVYFVANSVLAEGAVPGECGTQTPSPGATCNLYLRHGGVTKFVALLSAEDGGHWLGAGESASSRVSPDGKWAEFMSLQPVTGYDNRDAVSGKPDAEVYLYSASAGRVVCASCNPSGARPRGTEYINVEGGYGGLAGGSGLLGGTQWVAANVPGWVLSEGGSLPADQPRYLSDSGRLFFDSGDALVPQDVNGTEDVYEYEPAGVGSCTSASATFSESSGGCLGLISSGTSAGESAFLDASETGGDVFFMTNSRLQPQDYDSAYDVYDAHECTSAVPCFPVSDSQPPACTTAEACRAAQTPQPANFGAPSSSTFSGAGNIAPGSGGVVTVKSLTRAQRLASALKVCKRKPKRKRAGCERHARAQYGPVKPGKAAAKKGKR